MSEMPSSDSLPLEDAPMGEEPIMEGAPGGEDPAAGMAAPAGPPMMPPPAEPEPDPMQSVLDDTAEMEARDELELELLLAGIRMAKAAGIASEGASAKDAELFASAAQHLAQAAVLLAPQEAIDDAAVSGGDTAATQGLWDSTTKGVRRTSGS